MGLYNKERIRITLDFHLPSKAKQSFRDEADINNIMKKYIQTGILPVGERKPQYGDFYNVEQYQDTLQKIVDCNNDFEKLPSELRELFENDPENLIRFLSDPANEDEAIELGLIAAPEGYKVAQKHPTLEADPLPGDQQKKAAAEKQSIPGAENPQTPDKSGSN